ncbi:hypothetical protein CHC07_06049 [Variovorax sp. B4]|nr:hypothetical protein CHC06_06143 [Variovorax sp. B2]PNG51392.1 hypothetical protein CHC07_06049 [Variovorax sp. B4]
MSSCDTPAHTGLTPANFGLFGTCGPSSWRRAFRTALEARGVTYFDPQVESWTPELAPLEALHLANDQLVVFAVTEETFGFGSLAETGFPLHAVRATSAQHFVLLYIAEDVSEELWQASRPRPKLRAGREYLLVRTWTGSASRTYSLRSRSRTFCARP